MKKPTRKQLVNQAFLNMKIRGIKNIDEIRPAQQPGYWVALEPSHSKDIRKDKPFSFMVENNEYYRVYSYTEFGVRMEDGKFVSPFRAWKAWKALYPSIRRLGEQAIA